MSAKPEVEIAPLRALLPYLKHRMAEQRCAILELPLSRPTLVVEDRQRRPTGDTLRLRRPSFGGDV